MFKIDNDLFRKIDNDLIFLRVISFYEYRNITLLDNAHIHT